LADDKQRHPSARRVARRQLKVSGGSVYAGVKAGELKLEQIEQALLYD